jgi:hypothetical protein
VELPTRTKKSQAGNLFRPNTKIVKLYVRIRQRAVDSKQATALGQRGQFHFLEGWFDMRNLGAVLDHEEPLPHPVEDRQQ